MWLTGGVGAGKTTVIKEIVQPLLGDMGNYFEGGTTEAGIRQTLGSDALPVIYDEAEKKDASTDRRLQSMLLLARSASSTSEHAITAKGTQTGKALAFHVRSMFLMASVGAALKDEADRQRVCVLPLKARANMEKGEKEAHWRKYKPRLKGVNAVVGRELMARTMTWIRDGRLDRTVDTFKDAATDVFSDPRFGDQYGTLYAGAWTLVHDDLPDPMEAREMIAANDVVVEFSDPRDDAQKVISILLQQELRIDTSQGSRQATVGQLISISAGDAHGSITTEEADARLRMIGVRLYVHQGARMVHFANTSEWIASVLEKTQYHDIQSALRTMSGACVTNPVRFHAGFTARCTAVPLAVIDAV